METRVPTYPGSVSGTCESWCALIWIATLSGWWNAVVLRFVRPDLECRQGSKGSLSLALPAPASSCQRIQSPQLRSATREGGAPRLLYGWDAPLFTCTWILI